MRRLLPATLALLALTAASPTTSSAPTVDPERYLAQFIDPSVDPRQDFFHYAVGEWLHDHPIPAAERSWGIGDVVQEETYGRLVQISEEAAASPAAPGSNEQKIGDFWFAAMDSVTNAKQGFDPLADEFARIHAIKDRNGLLAEIARLKHIGVGGMCALRIEQDEMRSDRYVVHLDQGGLGLPNRDYYFDADDRSRMLRTEYVAHVAATFRLLGDDSARAGAEAGRVMALETELAGASRKLEDLRDPRANYHAMSVAGVTAKLTPSIHWRQFLGDGGVTGIDSVVVGQPEFFRQLEKSLRGRPLPDWITYLRWHLATAYAAEAGGRYEAENFHFYGTVLNGTPEERPRWKRMLDEEEGYLGDALGQLYVHRYFTPKTRERYSRLTDEIFAAFQERIRQLDWMSEPTKQRALRKLAAVTKKVGYPDHWRDYSAYRIDRTSFLGNCVRGRIWQADYRIAKLHKPVDRTEWDMTPQTYNAYYNPSNNEIVLPAAAFILPGIPDSLVDDALVYSYAGGSTIGHEITHGFDDEGRQFDEHGNLAEWWTPQDEKEFKQRADRIVRQFDAYVATGDLHVNGKASQGENIADLGGIQLGWDAFQKTAEFQHGGKIGGLTPQQRYFIGWALSWMDQLRPENIAMRVKTDVHAPTFLRVTGPVSNLVPFYEAYGVRPGDAMFRDDSVRVRIWEDAPGR